MRVSTKSWHYQLAKFGINGYQPSSSLCLYFWQVLFGVALSLLILLAGCGLAFLVFSPLLMFFFVELAWVGVASCSLMLSVFMFFLFFKTYDKVKDASFTKVAHQYLKKKGVCPTIDFVDGAE